MAQNKNQTLSFSLIIGFGLLTAVLFWYSEKDYIAQEKDRIELSLNDLEGLNAAVGKYVIIKNACQGRNGLKLEENSSIKEVFPLVKCNKLNGDSIHVFSTVENDFLPTLFFIHNDFEEGAVSLFEGELGKSNYFSSSEKKVLDELNIKYSNNRSFNLLSGKTPARTKQKLVIQLILIALSMAIGCFLVTKAFKAKQ